MLEGCEVGSARQETLIILQTCCLAQQQARAGGVVAGSGSRQRAGRLQQVVKQSRSAVGRSSRLWHGRRGFQKKRVVWWERRIAGACAGWWLFWPLLVADGKGPSALARALRDPPQDVPAQGNHTAVARVWHGGRATEPAGVLFHPAQQPRDRRYGRSRHARSRRNCSRPASPAWRVSGWARGWRRNR